MKYIKVGNCIIHLPSIRHVRLSGFGKLIIAYREVEEVEEIGFDSYEEAKKEYDYLWLSLTNMREG